MKRRHSEGRHSEVEFENDLRYENAIPLNLKLLNKFQKQVQRPDIYKILIKKININLATIIWQYMSLFTYDEKQNRIILTRPVYFELSPKAWAFKFKNNKKWSQCYPKYITCSRCLKDDACYCCAQRCNCSYEIIPNQIGKCCDEMDNDFRKLEKLGLEFIKLHCLNYEFMQSGDSQSGTIYFNGNESTSEKIDFSLSIFSG